MDLDRMLDGLAEMVYFSDLDTYELLYLNAAGRKQFDNEDYHGKKCYEVLQGFHAPCPFCTNEKLKDNEFYFWEYDNPKIQCHVSLRDTITKYKGKRARMEIAFDLTELNEKNQQLEQSLDAEKITLQCVRALYETPDPKAAIQSVLGVLTDFLKAERSYVFEITDDIMNNTYEWCREGIASQQNHCQGMPLSLLSPCMEHFNTGDCSIYDNTATYRANICFEHNIQVPRTVDSVMLAPIHMDNNLIGFLGVDNPDASKFHAGPIMNTVGYLFSVALDKIQTNEILIQHSYYDLLTGLYNRNRFMEDLDKLNHKSDIQVGIVYVDVNGLKDINDQFGHRHGDSILIKCADLLRSQFKGETIYRIGGDEFIILSEKLEKQILEERIGELRNMFLSNADCQAAIGMTWATNTQNLQAAVSLADENMYSDKKAFYRAHPFTSRYRHDSDNALGLSDENVLISRLDNHYFHVYLQPKFILETRQIIGSEALIRYVDEKGVVTSPGQFIPTLEEARTIYHLDYYVFEQVCMKIKDWLSADLDVKPISINFSRYTLMRTDFINRINEIWATYDIPKELLEIEIIESVESVDNDALMKIANKIKLAGFSVSIDDFGVKYSNIGLFTAADIDTLKLDRSLLLDIETNRKSQLLIGALAQICRNLRIQMIVEGVESESQYLILKELECYGAQGYLFSHPLPSREFEKRFMPKKMKS